MSDIDHFLVELIAKINTAQAITDVKELEKELQKRKINLKAVMDMSARRSCFERASLCACQRQLCC